MNTSEFLNETIEIERNIDEINLNIRQIQTIQTRQLTLTSEEQENTFSQERNRLTDIILKSLTETKDRIRKIESENINLQKINHPDVTLRENRHALLKRKFTNALNTYREIEDTYMKQQKDKITRQYQLVYPEATEEEVESYLQNPNEKIFFTHSTLGIEDHKEALAEVQKRYDDIQYIEKTIAELLKLFDEIRLHVEEADTSIQELETTAEEHVVEMEKANSILEAAVVDARSARNKKWICASVTLMEFLLLFINL
ncbi:14340_t:CDS:2 [Gigaspora margarita]|uniref:14340_t:CDS:1 n=1 Tax=Gigaspora margarita TaxID=4874 RepID=A0ABN7UW64_GIGMA|nr:14340_t:CDS:2 [Gigaspora margarita]